MPLLEAVKINKERKRDFSAWLHEEITRCISERAELEQEWDNALTQWRADIPKTQKDFPFVGASNIRFPLTAMHSDPIYSDFMQTLHAPEDYWTPVAKRPDRTEHVTALRRFTTALDKNFLHMRQVNGRALLDQNIMGTAIYKNHWLHERKAVRDYAPDGSGRIETRTKARSMPVIEHVPLQHFYIPSYAWNVDPDAPVGAARWVAQKFWLRPEELKLRAQGDPTKAPYDRAATDRVMAFSQTPEDRLDDKIREQSAFVPSHHERIELWEVWVRYDLDNDGVEEDMVVVFHRDTGEILRALHNPFLHGRRPFNATRYLPTFGFYGQGLAKVDDWAQRTLTKFLNCLLDNALIANTRMYHGPLGMNIQPGEPIYPGKIWLHGPDEQIGELRMGDIHPSLPMIIGNVMQWGDLRAGMSDIRQGDVSGLPSRTPATTVLSMLRESNKRFDMILANFREVHGEMGLRMLQNVASAYRDDPLQWQTFCVQALGQQDAAKVIEILTQTQGDLEASFGVTVTATSALVNKEAEKQSFIGMMQVVLPMYGQLVQTAIALQQLPPQTPAYETAAASYTAGVELIERLLERFDIQNPSQYLGNMEAIAGALNASAQGMNPATAAMQQAGMPAQGAGMLPFSPYPSPTPAIPGAAGVFGF